MTYEKLEDLFHNMVCSLNAVAWQPRAYKGTPPNQTMLKKYLSHGLLLG